jgi:membrane protease YdiL (CAAX protease family)
MNDILMSALIQISFVLMISWIFYVVFCRKKNVFFNWIGLYLPKSINWVKSSVMVFILALIIMVGPLILFQYLGYITPEMTFDKTVTGQGLSINIIIIILIKAVFQTALSEEILFRGLIGKRIGNKFGYKAGNIVQAVIFGLPHGLPFIIVYNEYVVGITLIVTAGIVGYLEYWLNEKKGEGSLVPGIILHSTMNILSFTSKALI